MNFNDRYGASSGGTMDPEQLRAMVLRRVLGTTLTSHPTAPAPIEPAPVRTYVVPSPGGPATYPEPYVMDKGPPTSPVLPAIPDVDVASVPRKSFPDTAAPVPYSNPAVEQSPAGGLTLASNPVSNWAGSIGVQSPEEVKGFEKGTKYAELAGNIADMAKGLKPKAPDSQINALTPMTSQPNVPNAMAGELMAQLLKSKMNPRGLTMTGMS